MIHFGGLALLTWFLPGTARRSFRIDYSHHNAQQQDNTLAKASEGSAKLWEALVPGSFAKSMHASRRAVPLRPFGPRRASGTLNAASGTEEAQLPLKDSREPTKELAPGDTVVVIGASGNVGKLVALRLGERFRVRGVARDASRVAAFLPQAELFDADLVRGDASQLEVALKDAQAVVVCTGTTAFPTQAWSREGESVTGAIFSALAQSGWSKDRAIAVLSAEGYNTPSNVDDQGICKILKAWKKVAGGKRKRFVLMSSVGVQRRGEMPFPILNACGVLDAKAAAEETLKADAKVGGYSYTIVRPGQLFGGPYDNNYYLGTLFQLDKDAKTQDVTVGKGDVLMGDTLRSTLAEVIAQLLETGAAQDMDFAVVNTAGEPPDLDALRERLAML